MPRRRATERAPPEARAAFDRLIGEGLDRHEAIHAIGSVVAEAIWNVMRNRAPVDRDELARALAELHAIQWKGPELGDIVEREYLLKP